MIPTYITITQIVFFIEEKKEYLGTFFLYLTY